MHWEHHTTPHHTSQPTTRLLLLRLMLTQQRSCSRCSTVYPMLCHVSAVWGGARSSGCGWSGSSTWPSRRLSTNTTTAGNARATDGRAWLRRRPSERIERTLYSPILEQGAILQVRLPLLENLGAIEGIRGDISKKHMVVIHSLIHST